MRSERSAMLSNVLSSANGGVAARYAAQIRELLALSLAHLSAERAIEVTSVSAARVQSPATGSLGTVIDLSA
jgi:hypothetical protein